MKEDKIVQIMYSGKIRLEGSGVYAELYGLSKKGFLYVLISKEWRYMCSSPRPVEIMRGESYNEGYEKGNAEGRVEAIEESKL